VIPVKAFRKLISENPTVERRLIKKVYKNGKLVGFVWIG